MIAMAGHSDAVEILLAILNGEDYPPPGVPDTPGNRALWDATVADIAAMPPGMIVDVPFD
jgi:hypothetical protein